ncbi:GAF domain-containing protein [Kribbella sp. NPDC056861]|uniref:GAF domain-containing protein n=1 Tax=Kribbella sp. NPDC056861 TaxID=3154857 RepID=UPI00341E4340
MTLANPDRRRAHHRRETLASDPEQPSAKAFAMLASDLSVAPNLGRVLALVLECAVTAVHCDWAAIDVRPAGQSPAVSATSDPRLTDALGSRNVGTGGKYGLAVQPGPATVSNQGTSLDQLWQEWSTGLSELGVRSAYVVRLRAGQSFLGSITFYAAQTSRFGPDDKASADLLAVHAALAVAATQATADLTGAIESRTA